jgi:minor histocompatibility antigen H13
MIPSGSNQPMLTQTLYKASFVVLAGILAATRFVIIPANIQMGLITASILFIGAHQSIKLNEIDSATGKRADGDRMSKKDALMFPVFGSIALVSLYICYKYVGKEYMNILLTSYIMLAGVAAVANFIEPIFHAILPKSWNSKNHLLHFNIPSLLRKLADGQSEFRLHFGKADIITHIVGLALAVYFLKSKDFTVHNLFGIAFSIQAIKLISLGQFVNAFILLWGLFVYDVFWVFGTDVMVTVALSLEAPAKIIFPQSFEPWKQGILGLGDIVIPGIFVALCLRFDDYIYCLQQKKPHHRENINIFDKFPRVYFVTVMIGYIGGLVATAVAMHLMNAAQPALLYLVPGTTAPVVLVAAVRGHLPVMFKYFEDDKEEEAKEAPEEKVAQTKKETKKSK